MKVHRYFRFLAFGLLLLVIPAALSSPSSAQFVMGISVRIGPPALPVYEMPLCPGDGYMWTPGYWAWDDDAGYYWVPGTWVMAPTVGLLWTPGYWGWNDGLYVWNAGYWGPEIGFYGGVNYGFGYFGSGFGGGEWREGHFFYNTAVVNVNTTVIRNVYVNRTVIVNNDSHVAFNGGEGGIQARPTPREEAFARQPHTPPVAAQMQQEHAASQNKALFASTNHGAPAVAATARPGQFSGGGVVAAKAPGAPYRAPAVSPREARAPATAKPASGNSRPMAPPARTENAPKPEANRPPAARPENGRPENAPPAAHPENQAHPANAAKPKPEKPAPKPKEEKPEKEKQ